MVKAVVRFTKKNHFSLVVFFVLLLMYAIHDVSTSAQAGVKEANRGTAHLYLIVLIAYMTIVTLKMTKFRLLDDRISYAVFSILIWVCCVNLINGASFWESMIYIAFSFWWLVVYKFSTFYCLNYYKSTKLFKVIVYMIFIVYVLVNLYSRFMIMVNFERDNAVTGYIYYVVTFLPFIMLVSNRIWQTILLGILLIMTITSLKRGAIIVLPLMLIVYFYLQAKLRNNIVLFFKKMILFVMILLPVLMIVDSKSDHFLSARFQSEELQSGSGRDVLYETAIHSIMDRDFVTFFIGTGSGSSVKLLDTGVHNEWLEILFSFGFMGVILYLSFLASLIAKFRYLKRIKSEYAPHFAMVIVYIFMVGLFGAFYWVHSAFFIFLTLGYLNYLEKNEKMKIEK